MPLRGQRGNSDEKAPQGILLEPKDVDVCGYANSKSAIPPHRKKTSAPDKSLRAVGISTLQSPASPN
jgi:hypothetical protein